MNEELKALLPEVEGYYWLVVRDGGYLQLSLVNYENNQVNVYDHIRDLEIGLACEIEEITPYIIAQNAERLLIRKGNSEKFIGRY